MSTVIDRHSQIDPWWVDVLLERYVHWREECITVRHNYQAWNDSDRDQRSLAYAGYLAALEREEQAARAYADQIERVRQVCV
jgi:hypothetical protein